MKIAVKGYHKRLRARVSASGGHFEYHDVMIHIADTDI